MWPWRAVFAACLGLAALCAQGQVHAQVQAQAVDAGIPWLDIRKLGADYWIARTPQPGRVLLDAAQIARWNARLVREDPSMHDLAALPDRLDSARVRDWIATLGKRPSAPRYDAAGRAYADADWAVLHDALALGALPPQVTPTWALVTRRSAVRSLPTVQRAFSQPADRDIDRWQETALFPGTPVAVVHASGDGAWRFVIAETYAGWIRADALASGPRAQVLGYATRVPALRITGARAHAATTPEAPAVSALALDMGTRLPLLPWPSSAPVNGQHAAMSHVVELPTRAADGGLRLVPALLPRSEDARVAPLPLTRANLLRQAFKFLGERYGWGHDFDARDCSGFVSEVYRSMELKLPRNTGDQAASPLLREVAFDTAWPAERRNEALRALQVGDLVFIPGHVMLVIGHAEGQPWVIHDIHGGGWRDARGRYVAARLNGVTVTPLASLRLDADTAFVDRITAIRRVAPPAAEPAR